MQAIGQYSAFSSSFGLAQNVPASNPFYAPQQAYKNNVQVNKTSSFNMPFVNQVPASSLTYANYPTPNNYYQQQSQYENYAPSLFQNNIGVNSGLPQIASIKLLNKK